MKTRYELKNYLNDLIARKPTAFTRWLEMNSEHEWLEALLEYSPLFLKEDPRYKLKTLVYWFLHDLKEFPKCLNESCNNTLEGHNIRNMDKGFPLHCCPQCGHESKHREEANIKTCMDRYGVKNGSATQQAKDKRKEKALTKFGVDNVAKAPGMPEKWLKTREQKYGCRNLLSNPEIRKRASDKYYEKTGHRWWTGTREWKEKYEATSVSEFGTTHFMKNPELRKSTRLRYCYKGINFDSSWELAVYIWLVDHKVDFEYQPSEPELTYIDFDGIMKRYCPDFKIMNQLVEIKGDNFFDKHGNPKLGRYDWKAKYQCMLDNKVEVWTYKIVKPYIEYVETKYGDDYLKQFRKKLSKTWCSHESIQISSTTSSALGGIP